MAEISRKSGRRILESIDTKKASKQEVFDFYKRFRTQKKRSGEKIPLLKIKEVKKSELVSLLEAWEREPLERELEAEYTKMQQKMTSIPPEAAAKQYTQFQKQLQFLKSMKMINPKNILGGTLEQPFEVKESQPQRVTQQVQVTKYKGRYAHDLIAKWVDDGLLDTEDYDDSDQIWEFMSTTNQKHEEYDFFNDFYAGENKEGSKAFFDDFKEFLQDSENFERSLRMASKPVPEYGTRSYWDALAAWRDEQNSRL